MVQPPLPDGYDYDFLSPEVFLNQLSVRDGHLVLAGGVGYRVLVLPSITAATPQWLRKLRELLRAGAVVIANGKPGQSPSLEGFPQCDAEVAEIADELWGPAKQGASIDREVGSGRLVQGCPLAGVLDEMGIGPDFRQLAPTPRALRRIHRQAGEADLFFVANPNTNAVAVECEFRVNGKQPEIWRAETGETEFPAIWRTNASHCSLPLRLHPLESVFVVFRQQASHLPVKDLECRSAE
jgi:hypothetical protein